MKVEGHAESSEAHVAAEIFQLPAVPPEYYGEFGHADCVLSMMAEQ